MGGFYTEPLFMFSSVLEVLGVLRYLDQEQRYPKLHILRKHKHF